MNLEALLEGLRFEYMWGKLDRKDLSPSPFAQFAKWFKKALETKNGALPNTAVLATASKSARPSARVVLVKGASEKGFVFFTAHTSRKAQELEENPWAEMVFYWAGQERQARVRGRVAKLSKKESEEYFRTRPRETQIACWACRQSQPVASRAELDRRVEEYSKKFEGAQIPMPSAWGGYCLVPSEFEFWQGRLNRLNDRFLYRKKGKTWAVTRLEP